MKSIAEIFFPHEEALRAIFANQEANSAQEKLQLIVANQHKLTRDQQLILREGLAELESMRRIRGSENRLLDENMAHAILMDLAEPYARAGKDRVLGAEMGGPEAARYAHSYVPLTMDARDYLWGDENMELINHTRRKRLAELDDEEIERIMNEHKEMIVVLYENPDVAQYYPCVPATEERQKAYPLEKALKVLDESHKRLWSEIHELRKQNGDARSHCAKEKQSLF
jgi:hypothetical protein